MWILVSAIVTASLLGSMHCVGMCGPLAIWASGAGDRASTWQMSMATTLYHLGRLLTYAVAGALAGAAGQLVDFGGQALGFQLVAARLVGSLMILFGVWRLLQLWQQMRSTRTSAAPMNFTASAPQPNLVTRWLLRLRPLVFRLPIPARGLATGLLTAFLPCGWLYLFALVAAGTGSAMMGAIVMSAFWIGTVPALVGLVTGTQALGIRFRKIIPTGAALLLIVGGGYTAAGRGFASLNSLADIQLRGSTEFAKQIETTPAAAAVATESQLAQSQAQRVAAGLAELTQTTLPCCAAHAAAQGLPQTESPTASESAVATPQVTQPPVTPPSATPPSATPPLTESNSIRSPVREPHSP